MITIEGVHTRIGIVAFGFGEPASTRPNQHIHAKAVALVGALTASVLFTDRDIFSALREGGAVVEELDPTQRPTTYRLAKFAVAGAEKHRLTELHVVAAPCHIWRCVRDLRWVAVELGVEAAFTPCPIDSYHYDRSATTVFTRSAWMWWPFEIAYRIASTLFPSWYKRTRA